MQKYENPKVYIVINNQNVEISEDLKGNIQSISGDPPCQ